MEAAGQRRYGVIALVIMARSVSSKFFADRLHRCKGEAGVVGVEQQLSVGLADPLAVEHVGGIGRHRMVASHWRPHERSGIGELAPVAKTASTAMRIRARLTGCAGGLPTTHTLVGWSPRFTCQGHDWPGSGRRHGGAQPGSVGPVVGGWLLSLPVSDRIGVALLVVWCVPLKAPVSVSGDGRQSARPLPLRLATNPIAPKRRRCPQPATV